MHRALLPFLALFVVYGALVLALPETTVSPGDLLAGHASIASGCLECHAPLRGATAERCVACHRPDEIGVVTTRGEPLPVAARVRFHDALLEPACVACHSDHRGAEAGHALVEFEHRLLIPAARNDCARCHVAAVPSDELHRRSPRDCGRCHQVEGWKPARFDHTVLGQAERAACVACHRTDRPTDVLHRDVDDACGSCHRTEAWKPATFEHDRFFRFDRHHPSECRTCHPQTLDRYTCYECHEHAPAEIAREHQKEGIRDFGNCVRCHRSGDEKEAERDGEGREGRRGGGRNGRGGEGPGAAQEDDD